MSPRSHPVTRITTALAILAGLAGCNQSETEEPASRDKATDTAASVPAFIRSIAEHHNQRVYDTKQAVQGEFTVDFGDRFSLTGSMLFDRPLGRAKLTLDNGAVIIWSDGEAFASGPEVPNARFHALTWPYFVAAPFKLDDPGIVYEDVGLKPGPNADPLPAFRVGFEPGVGDAPDDWYYAMRRPDDAALRALVYIVSYGRDLEQANANPSIITYDAFQTVEGVVFPQAMSFYYWDEQAGLTEPKGNATFTDASFVRLNGDEFDRPADARTLTLPGA